MALRPPKITPRHSSWSSIRGGTSGSTNRPNSGKEGEEEEEEEALSEVGYVLHRTGTRLRAQVLQNPTSRRASPWHSIAHHVVRRKTCSCTLHSDPTRPTSAAAARRMHACACTYAVAAANAKPSAAGRPRLLSPRELLLTLQSTPDFCTLLPPPWDMPRL